MDLDVYLTRSANQQCLHIQVQRLVKRSTNRNCPIVSSQNKMAAPVGVTFTAKAADFSTKFCVMHVVPSAKSNFIVFHKDNWRRFVDFASMWLKFDCKEREIVTETATKLGVSMIFAMLNRA